MGVCLPVAVIDWAAAGIGPEETYTAGNWEAGESPLLRRGKTRMGYSNAHFICGSLSLSVFMRVGRSGEETPGMGRRRCLTPLVAL